MWIIEMRRKDIGPKWFRIWSSEVGDKNKRGPTYCAEYLKTCVENEIWNKDLRKEREYRMRYILK